MFGFDGNYVTGDIDSNYLDELHERRNDANKNNVDKNLHSVKHESAMVDLYNDTT